MSEYKKTTIKNISEFFEQRESQFIRLGISGIFLHGSLVRNNFIEGWSDIDLLTCLELDSNFFDSSQLINNIVEELSSEFNIKCGVNIVFSDTLDMASRGNYSLIDFKTLCYLNNGNPLHTLFSKNGYNVPKFSFDKIPKDKIEEHAIFMLNYFTRVDHNLEFVKSPKALIRKYYKNCIFSLQMIDLIDNGIIHWKSDEIIKFAQNYLNKNELNFLIEFKFVIHEWSSYNPSKVELRKTKDILKKLLQSLLIKFYNKALVFETT